MKKNVDMRYCSLEELALSKIEAQVSFSRAAKSIPTNGGAYRLIRERLVTGNSPDMDFEYRIQQEVLESVRNSQDATSERIDSLKAEIESYQDECEKLYKAYIEAREEFQQATVTLNQTKKKLENSQKEFVLVGKAIKKEEQIAENIRGFVLVHKSACLNQLIDNQYGTYVATECDETMLKSIGCADKVFRRQESLGFITVVPNEIMQASISDNERESMKLFAEMVIFYMLEYGEEKVKPVYSCKEIAMLLSANGYSI